jgi:hypothetical protein
MPDEEDAGASYLAALRQSSAPRVAGAAPARPPDVPLSVDSRSANAALPTKSAGSEKRQSPRYRCTGSVRLQKSGSEASTWETFTDISVHGCYVELASPYRQGTIVDLKLDANGFRVEATGEVRVAYPSLGMGISFTKMSEADRGQLRALMSSISSAALSPGPRLSTQSLSKTPSDIAAVTNPNAALQAMLKFFENRHMMGREEFLSILRKNR